MSNIINSLFILYLSNLLNKFFRYKRKTSNFRHFHKEQNFGITWTLHLEGRLSYFFPNLCKLAFWNDFACQKCPKSGRLRGPQILRTVNYCGYTCNLQNQQRDINITRCALDVYYLFVIHANVPMYLCDTNKICRRADLMNN